MIRRKTGPVLLVSLTALTLVLSSVPLLATAASDSGASEEGKELAFSRKKGNCLACHAIQGGESPGNIAPPLMAMKQRYPEKARLRAQIWDATAANPDTPMPPFGKHRILTEGELDKVVEFIWSL